MGIELGWDVIFLRVFKGWWEVFYSLGVVCGGTWEFGMGGVGFIIY